MKRILVLYDFENNSYTGEIDSKGGISLYGNDGQYVYGEIDSKGAITLYDEDNNFISGDADKNGNVSLYDDAGNHWYGEIKTSQQELKWSELFNFHHCLLKGALKMACFKVVCPILHTSQ